jgi:AcrR family transcriptional regulator
VATEYTGSGDPKRSMELLWALQPRPRRGPKPRLTVDQIVRTAVAIADADGLVALSMRRVADELNVAPMSLYTYVPGKAELVDLMLDLVCSETARPPHEPGRWRASLEQIARENWALYHRHPWMLQVAAHRPPLGPGIIAKYDYELSAVEGVGLSDVEIDSVLTLVQGYTAGAARGSVEAAQAEQRTGLSDEQWWEANAPLLEQVFDAQRYPVAARVGAAAGEAHGGAYGPRHAFEFGLQRVLDGIGLLIAPRQPQ